MKDHSHTTGPLMLQLSCAITAYSHTSLNLCPFLSHPLHLLHSLHQRPLPTSTPTSTYCACRRSPPSTGKPPTYSHNTSAIQSLPLHPHTLPSRSHLLHTYISALHLTTCHRHHHSEGATNPAPLPHPHHVARRALLSSAADAALTHIKGHIETAEI